MVQVVIRVVVELEKVSGVFISRSDLVEAIRDELGIDSLSEVTVDDSTYEVTSAEADEESEQERSARIRAERKAQADANKAAVALKAAKAARDAQLGAIRADDPISRIIDGGV